LTFSYFCAKIIPTVGFIGGFKMARGEKAERTYQQILAVSARLFREHGYEKTSIQDILNELKMSKGAVYHHFNSKKEILDAIEEKKASEQIAMLRKLIKETKGKNALEKVTQGFLKFIEATDFHENDKEAMIAHLDPHTMISDIKGQLELSKFLVELIEEGVADGSIETEYPLELAEVFFMLFQTWLNPILFPRSFEETRRRLVYLQFIMKNLGFDFIPDEVIEMGLAGYQKAGYI